MVTINKTTVATGYGLLNLIEIIKITLSKHLLQEEKENE